MAFKLLPGQVVHNENGLIWTFVTEHRACGKTFAGANALAERISDGMHVALFGTRVGIRDGSFRELMRICTNVTFKVSRDRVEFRNGAMLDLYDVERLPHPNERLHDAVWMDDVGDKIDPRWMREYLDFVTPRMRHPKAQIILTGDRPYPLP